MSKSKKISPAVVKALKEQVSQLTEKRDRLQKNLNLGSTEITEYCAHLRSIVDLETESRRQDLLQLNREVIKEIDNFEKDCLYKFTSAKKTKASKEVKPVIDRLDQFLHEANRLMDCEEEKTVIKLTDKAEEKAQEADSKIKWLRSQKFGHRQLQVNKSSVKPRSEWICRLEPASDVDFCDLDLIECLPNFNKLFGCCVETRGEHIELVVCFSDNLKQISIARLTPDGEVLSRKVLFKHLTTIKSIDLFLMPPTEFVLKIDCKKRYNSMKIQGNTVYINEYSSVVMFTRDGKYVQQLDDHSFDHVEYEDEFKLAINSSYVFRSGMMDEFQEWIPNIALYSTDFSYSDSVSSDRVPGSPDYMVANDKYLALLYHGYERSTIIIVSTSSWRVKHEFKVKKDDEITMKLFGDDYLAIYHPKTMKFALYSQKSDFQLVEEHDLRETMNRKSNFKMSNDNSSKICFFNEIGLISHNIE